MLDVAPYPEVVKFASVTRLTEPMDSFLLRRLGIQMISLASIRLLFARNVCVKLSLASKYPT